MPSLMISPFQQSMPNQDSGEQGFTQPEIPRAAIADFTQTGNSAMAKSNTDLIQELGSDRGNDYHAWTN